MFSNQGEHAFIICVKQVKKTIFQFSIAWGMNRCFKCSFENFAIQIVVIIERT